MTKVIGGHPQQFKKNYIITALTDIKSTLSISPITNSTLAILVKHVNQEHQNTI